MVLSLFVAVPAKSEAAPGGYVNKNLCTISLGTYRGMYDGTDPVTGKPIKKYEPGLYDTGVKGDTLDDPAKKTYGTAGEISLTSVKLGDQEVLGTAVYYTEMSIHNGSYTLDPDDRFRLLHKTNTFTIVLYTLHNEDWENLAGVQVLTGNYPNLQSSYTEAQFVVGDGYVIVTFATTPNDEPIALGDVLSLRTNIAYQYYFSNYKELKGFTDLMFTQSVLTWKYTDNGSAAPAAIKWSYPTYPILNSAPYGDADKYYAVETIVSAKPGYTFFTEGTDWTVAANRANNTAYNTALATAMAKKNEGLTPADPEYDHRVFTITDISKDGKTAKLTITHIYPVTTSNYIDPAIQSIELTRELNFATNKVNTVAEARANMPTKFTVTLNGEKKTMDLTTLINNKRIYWAICGVSTDNLTLYEMADQDEIVKSRYNDAGNLLAAAPKYYAVLKMVDENWNPYTLAPTVMRPLMEVLFRASAADDHDLLNLYALDDQRVVEVVNGVGYNQTATPLQAYGWTIAFTVNGAKNYGGMVNQETPGLAENAAPTIMFNGFGTNYTMTAYGAGTTHSYYAETAAPGTWNVIAGNSMAVGNDARYFKAYIDLIANVYTESPVVYSYFDPQVGENKEAKQGVVSVTVQEPELYSQVEYKVRAVAGSMDLADGASCPLNYDKTELYWVGNLISGLNTGAEMFAAEEDYAAVIAIPVNSGWTLAFTPEVRFNGYKADEVEIVEDNGVTYLMAAYTFKATTSDWDVEKDYCYKPLRISGLGATLYAGATIPTKLSCTESSARFYDFVDVTWYENGVEIDGGTFQLDKVYTAVVTYDCSKFAIKENNEVKELVMAGALISYGRVKDAKILKDKKELTATITWPAVALKKVTGIQDLVINVPNGMEVADFYRYVDAQLFPIATYADGTTGVLPTWSIVCADGKMMTYADIATAFAANYPGILGYKKDKKEAQEFRFTGIDDVYEKSFNIIIRVAGQKQAVNFDANGGVYTGGTLTAEQGVKYGFTYVPSQIYREGYLFAGWFSQANGGTRIKSATIFDGKVTTLYAHWVKVFTGKVWTVKAVSYTAGRITVTAGGVKTKVDGYEFSYSADGKTWTTFTQSKGKNTAYITGLQSKKAYFVRVRAYRLDSAGKFVYSGAYSNVKKVVVK